jgi:hypothetical protein
MGRQEFDPQGGYFFSQCPNAEIRWYDPIVAWTAYRVDTPAQD